MEGGEMGLTYSKSHNTTTTRESAVESYIKVIVREQLILSAATVACIHISSSHAEEVL